MNTVIDFGKVHLQNKKIHKIYLLNDTLLDAEFKIKNQPFPDTKYTKASLMTKEDKEDDSKIDDSSVFIFENSKGIVSSGSIALNPIPTTVHFNNNEKIKYAKEIKILFQPK